MKLPSPVANALELAINNALALDEDSFQQVTRLAGKIIKFQFLVVDVEFYLAPVGDGIQVLTTIDEEPDTIIEGSPLALLRTAVTKDRQTILQGDVKIHGDMDLGQKFQKILHNLDPDWEEPLARMFGDVAGHQIGEFIRGVNAFALNAFNSLTNSTAEYFQEESRDIVSPTECERYSEGVDQLRGDADRLQLRIQRLQQRLEEQ